MAQHFSQSKAYRNLTASEIEALTEDQAWEWFGLARWGSMTHMPCPECGIVDRHSPVRQRKQWRCKHCSRFFSVTSETPFADRKLSFKKLLGLIYAYICRPKGLSANQASAEMGTTYRTAFQNLLKIREAIFQAQDRSPMTGLVQIDGGHFGGKPRRPRRRQKMTSEIVNNHLKNRKAGMVPNRPKSSIEPWNLEKLKKRRIVLVLRQIGGVVGAGATRTITCIVHAEDAQQAIPIIQKYVAGGSTIHSDDGRAYGSLSAWYNHATVRHSAEYSTEDGVNNNQAESYFGRFRRAEYGVYHGMRPQYLAFYAAEIAWREDNRKLSLRDKMDKLLACLLSAGISLAFRGYAHGHRLGFEYIG